MHAAVNQSLTSYQYLFHFKRMKRHFEKHSDMPFMTYLNEHRAVVATGLPGNRPDASFSESVWASVLNAAARTGRCDEEMLIQGLECQPRDCLMVPFRKKEFEEAIEPLIDGDDDEDEQENVESLLVAILKYHNSSMSANGGMCRLGHRHDLLYVGASVARHHKFRNSSICSSLLRSIHDCDGGFDRILAPNLLGQRLSYVLSGWKSHEEDAESPSTMFFWANHATQSNMKFGYPPQKFVDAILPTLQNCPPLTVAIQADNVKAIHNLLVLGANVDTRCPQSPLMASLLKLSTHARSILSLKKPCHCEPLISLYDYRDTINNILKTTLKKRGCECERSYPITYPPPALKILNMLLSLTNGRNFPEHPEIIHPRVILDDLLPLPSLKQLCRVVVRQALDDVKQIPRGIKKLPVPTSVRSYLSLQEY